MSLGSAKVAAAQSPHRQGRGHQLQHAAAIGRHGQRLGQAGKFLSRARDKRRIVRQLLQAAPLLAHRWHIEQSVRVRPLRWYSASNVSGEGVSAFRRHCVL